MISTAAAAKDYEVAQSPADGISDLAFSSQADYLAASSWDNQTRIYEVQPSGNAVGKAVIQHEAPALGVCWSKDGTKVVSVGADKAARMLDLGSGQTMQVAGHDAPIKCCRWIDGVANLNNILVTGSWDKTLKYWDLRNPAPVLTVPLPERCYTMDTAGPLLVCGTADRHILMYNLSNPGAVFKQIVSPLKWQTRVVSCFPSYTGFAVGSIEGRVAIHHVEEKDAGQNFSFKCHRDEKAAILYPVNDISFHPIYGTFSTAGGDGMFNFWDKDSRQRLKTGPNVGMPISSTAFSRNGSIFAYAMSYDWSKGHEQYKQGERNVIMLHAVKDDEIKSRPRRR
ncbi:WD40-repeat-containing domain protein [Entophlyctis helioformis]|nr:WD40-repeat-containing domain protein [Entophlyctis helioformis]